MVIMTTEQVNEIIRNLAYNYWIIDRVLICLSIKSKLLNQDENTFIGMFIDEASAGTLIDRLYEVEMPKEDIAEDKKSKKDKGKAQKIRPLYYYDSLRTSDIVTIEREVDVATKNKKGESIISHEVITRREIPTKLFVEKLKDIFGLSEDIFVGKRRIDLGIEVPSQLLAINAKNYNTAKFENKFIGWDEYLNHVIVESQPKFNRTSVESVKEMVELLKYDPLSISGLISIMYIIEQYNFKLPHDFMEYISKEEEEALIEDFLKERTYTTFSKKLKKLDQVFNQDMASNKGKPHDVTSEIQNKYINDRRSLELSYRYALTILLPKRSKRLKSLLDGKASKPATPNEQKIIDKLKFSFKDEFADQFVYMMFYQFDDNGKPKENVYSLDSLIHSIADNTFGYFGGYKDKGEPIWRMLSQRDRTKKIKYPLLEIELDDIDLDIDLDNPEELADFVASNANAENIETAMLWDEIPLAVPMPLRLKKESELLHLIISIENMGYVFTLSGERKKQSI